jgi:hypothetical protein
VTEVPEKLPTPEVRCEPGVMYACRECDFVDEHPHLWCPHCGHGLMVPESVVLHRGHTAGGEDRVFVVTRSVLGKSDHC